MGKIVCKYNLDPIKKKCITCTATENSFDVIYKKNCLLNFSACQSAASWACECGFNDCFKVYLLSSEAKEQKPLSLDEQVL